MTSEHHEPTNGGASSDSAAGLVLVPLPVVGGYCDIPYQMLVGFDGVLYEGRALKQQSGATGGGNNPGNLVVCFIGCYHEPESECVGGVGHQPTDAMMALGESRRHARG